VAVGGNLIASPWYVGVDKGIFLKHGLDVKIRSFPQGSDSMKAIAAKEVDFAHTVNSTLLSAIEGGLPIVVLGSAVGDATRNFADDAFTLIGGPKVKTVQDLAGKKVGMVNQGTSPPFLRSILAKNGMTYDQVEIVNVPQANHARTLAAGQIDAVVTAEPYGVMALDMTPEATLLVRGGGYVSFAGEVFTRPDVVQNDPDTVQKLVDGFSEAAFVTRQNTDEVAEIVSHWMTGLEPGVAKRAIKYMYYDPRFSQLSLEGLQADMKALVEAKTLKGPIDLPKYMNLSYLDRTLQAHPEYFSDLKPAPPAKL
jgi:NitT/TauT family transport system substrate-binding protein